MYKVRLKLKSGKCFTSEKTYITKKEAEELKKNIIKVFALKEEQVEIVKIKKED